jgi:hypothetical protein
MFDRSRFFVDFTRKTISLMVTALRVLGTRRCDRFTRAGGLVQDGREHVEI